MQILDSRFDLLIEAMKRAGIRLSHIRFSVFWIVEPQVETPTAAGGGGGCEQKRRLGSQSDRLQKTRPRGFQRQRKIENQRSHRLELFCRRDERRALLPFCCRRSRRRSTTNIGPSGMAESLAT